MDNFSFTPTQDVELIKSVITQEIIYANLFDDFATERSGWTPLIHPFITYLAIRDDKQILLGIAICGVHSPICMEIHNCILPHVGWKKRIKIAHQFIEWISSFGYRRVIGKVLSTNMYTIKFNQIIGMEIIGVNKKAIMKNNELVDEMWFGLSLPIQENN